MWEVVHTYPDSIPLPLSPIPVTYLNLQCSDIVLTRVLWLFHDLVQQNRFDG